MNVKYINPFISGAVEVLKKMVLIELVAQKPFIKTTNEAHGDVTGIIGITGDATGSLAISFTGDCICHIVGRMLGEEYHEPTAEVIDAVGELTNIISGVARTKLEKEGMSVYASIPSVVFGANHTINHILKVPSIVIPFFLPVGPFFIDVCIKETGEKEKSQVACGIKNVHNKINVLPEGEGNQKSPWVIGKEKPSRENGGSVSRSPDSTLGTGKLDRLGARLSELLTIRDALQRDLTEKPFLRSDKRRLYKQKIALIESKIRRIKLDIAAMEMIQKMPPEQLESPTIVSHYQHYPKKR